MFDNTEMPVDAGQVEVTAQPQIENEEVTSVTEEVAEPQQPQSQDTNALFAKVRREAEQKAMDKVIAEVYGSQGINTYAEYMEAKRAYEMEQEAQEQGINPELYSKLATMEEKINAYEHEKTIVQQSDELKSDPVRGQLFNKYADEIMQIANDYNVDLKTAFTLTLDSKLSEIVNPVDTAKLKDEAVKEYLAGVKNRNTPVEGGGNSPVIVSQTPKNWDDARRGALDMLKSMRDNS